MKKHVFRNGLISVLSVVGVLLFGVLLFSNCSDDNTISAPGDQELNVDRGWKYLGSLNVKDAKLIYYKTSNVSNRNLSGNQTGRPTGRPSLTDSTGYYKLDINDDEVKLVITDTTGVPHNIGLLRVVKLSDEFLYIQPNWDDISMLVYGTTENVYVPKGRYQILVNIKTEKIYKFPEDIPMEVMSPHWTDDEFAEMYMKVKTDDKGNIYIWNGKWAKKIYKLNPKTLTMELALPGRETCNDFLVKNDFIFFWNHETNESTSNFIVFARSPSGRVFHTGISWGIFTLGDNFYALDNDSVCVFETVGDTIKEKGICKLPDINDLTGGGDEWRVRLDEPDPYWEFLYVNNDVRNTVVINNRYEFDGEKFTKISNEEFTKERLTGLAEGDRIAQAGEELNPETSKAWYKIDWEVYLNSQHILKASKADYSIKKILLPTEYQITGIVPNGDELVVTGYKKLDGGEITGVITENDEFQLGYEAPDQNLFNLVPLN